jgi:hypothetical protein
MLWLKAGICILRCFEEVRVFEKGMCTLFRGGGRVVCIKYIIKMFREKAEEICT